MGIFKKSRSVSPHFFFYFETLTSEFILIINKLSHHLLGAVLLSGTREAGGMDFCSIILSPGGVGVSP